MAAPALFSVGETSAEIPLPQQVSEALVLNSSEGLGDNPDAPDIIVNVGDPASLDPQQVGIRLQPGELFAFPLLQRSTGKQLPLSAIATGPGGQVTVVI